MDFIKVYKYLKGGCKKKKRSWAVLTGVQWQDKQQWAQTETHKVWPFWISERSIFCDSAVVAQRHCRLFICGDIQKLCGHCCRELAARGPDWERGWTRWPLEVPSSLNASVSCDTFRRKNNLLYDWLKANACKAIICIFCDISINFQTNKKKAFSASKSIHEHFINSVSNLSSVMRSTWYTRKQNI